ncbi:MAG: DUF4270 domain-containing protein [Flavobacteriaceae bacterium]|nr:DUF4270 domain-containing protein [Bacteroidia bacterium]NNK82530.1 DUF4270 domain-containing protein [Flavobacteriaceae bacterium]
MKNTKMNIKQFALLLSLLLVLTSCDKEFASLDTDIINNENADNFSTDKQDFPVITYTKTYSPFASNTLSSNLLGYYYHPIYGGTTANVVAQVSTSRFDPTFGDNVEVDSVVITIPYFSKASSTEDGDVVYKLDSVYGNSPVKLSIYQNNYFLRNYDPDQDFTEARNYYSDRSSSDANNISETDLEGQLLYTIDEFTPSNELIILSVPSPTEEDPDATEVTQNLIPSFRVKLFDATDENNTEDPADTYWHDLFFDLEGSLELSNPNNFLDHFRGFYFKSEALDMDNGNMTLLDFKNTGANFTIYYKNALDEGDTDNDGIPNYADVDVDGDDLDDNGEDSDDDGINNTYDIDSTDGTDEDEDGIDETVGPKTGEYAMSFSGNVVNIIENENFNITDGDDVNGDELLYLKGGEGSMAIVNLFNGDEDGNSTYLEDFKASNWLINEANLIFHVDQSQMLEDEPNRLFILDLENNLPLADYYLDQSVNNETQEVVLSHLGELEREGDELDGQGVQYKIKITEHINNIYKNDSTNVKLGLFVSSGVGANSAQNLLLKDYDENNTNFQIKNIISGAALTPKGTVLHGNNGSDPLKQVKLQIYYTEPN